MRRLVIIATLLATSCRQHDKADDKLCDAILKRTIDLELQAMGFHDPALAAMKRKQLAETLKGSLTSCVGKPAPKHAFACVQGATSMAELTHDCLAL